jgi:hypothetical protein
VEVALDAPAAEARSVAAAEEERVASLVHVVRAVQSAAPAAEAVLAAIAAAGASAFEPVVLAEPDVPAASAVRLG